MIGSSISNNCNCSKDNDQNNKIGQLFVSNKQGLKEITISELAFYEKEATFKSHAPLSMDIHYNLNSKYYH